MRTNLVPFRVRSCFSVFVFPSSRLRNGAAGNLQRTIDDRERLAHLAFRYTQRRVREGSNGQQFEARRAEARRVCDSRLREATSISLSQSRVQSGKPNMIWLKLADEALA